MVCSPVRSMALDKPRGILSDVGQPMARGRRAERQSNEFRLAQDAGATGAIAARPSNLLGSHWKPGPPRLFESYLENKKNDMEKFNRSIHRLNRSVDRSLAKNQSKVIARPPPDLSAAEYNSHQSIFQSVLNRKRKELDRKTKEKIVTSKLLKLQGYESSSEEQSTEHNLDKFIRIAEFVDKELKV